MRKLYRAQNASNKLQNEKASDRDEQNEDTGGGAACSRVKVLSNDVGVVGSGRTRLVVLERHVVETVLRDCRQLTTDVAGKQKRERFDASWQKSRIDAAAVSKS